MSTIAKTLADAQAAQGELRAGGTDVMDRLRHGVLKAEIIDISRIKGLDQITFASTGECSIGALVTIDQLANDPRVIGSFPGLAKAAAALANPQIRRAASMGGAIMQRNRCWYYRHEDISCFKKGGDSCPMREGNHQYGVCFDLGPCVAPHPSTLAMALLAYEAEVEVFEKGRRLLMWGLGDGRGGKSYQMLEDGDLLTHIHLKPIQDEKAAYFRSISRSRAEWPLVEVLAKGRIDALGVISQAKVVIGGVANIPLTLPYVNTFLNGKQASQEVFLKAGETALAGANPLPNTVYKLELVVKTIATALEMAFLNPDRE